MKWISRKDKTRQDQMPSDIRPRKREQDKRLDFMAKHKPKSSSDWNKYK